MCGIAGIVNFGQRQDFLSEGLIRAMTERISHRGPDADGFNLSSTVALGHRRLSIIDLSTGDQPMFAAGGQLSIVYNGEVYNYRELAKQLEAKGVRFETSSDTEVILRGYEVFGEKVVDHLNGMFAFAIWDERTHKLFIARDRFGEKPLYYWTDGQGGYLFGSELKSLVAHPAIERKINLDALGDYFARGYVSGERCIIDGVRKLEAAHSLTIDATGYRCDRYWSPLDTPIGSARNSDDWHSELHELIEESVKLRLRSDVPVGTFLSGGIDSSLISYFASKHYHGKLKTFCVKFNDPKADESVHAKAVAAQLGTDHQEIELKDFGIAELPELVAQFDEPFADPSSLATYFVTREASRQMKVCLSGDAGDELFGGYSRYAPEPLEQVLDGLPAGLGGKLTGALWKFWPETASGKGWLKRMSDTPVDRFLGRIWLFSPAEQRQLLADNAQQAAASMADAFRATASGIAASRDDWQLAVDQVAYLTDDILVKVDRTAMLNSLEVRVPLLDHRICELANSRPLGEKIVDGELKHPLKELARDLFPPEMTERKKHGFGLPLDQWFREGPLCDQFRDSVLQPNSAVADYVDTEYLNSLFLSHQKGYRDLGRKLWSIHWLDEWLRNNTRAD